MKQNTLHFLMAMAAVATAYLIASPGSLHAMGARDDRGVETAQYIKDREDTTDRRYEKGTVEDYRNKEMARTMPRFVTGVRGGLEAREGFGSASFAVPLGVQYGQFIMIFDLGMTYANSKSIKNSNPGILDYILRTKLSGQIIEFDLPFKFSYSFLDLDKNPYTPYLTAGVGYAYRKFHLGASSILDRIVRDFSINSFTINYGFGFLVRTSEDTRFNVGLSGISHFSGRSGKFGYDTTGVSLSLGLLAIF